MCFPILLFPHHLSLRFRKQCVCYCWIRAGWAIVHFGNPIRLWCPTTLGAEAFSPWHLHLRGPQIYAVDNHLCLSFTQRQGFQNQMPAMLSPSLFLQHFFLLLFINFKLKFNLIKYTGKLLDSNEGWEWKYLSMLLLANLPEGDIFQHWRKFLKGKSDRGSYSLPTACYQPSDKRSKHKELKREWEWWKHSSLPIAPDVSSLVILTRAFWWCNTWHFS